MKTQRIWASGAKRNMAAIRDLLAKGYKQTGLGFSSGLTRREFSKGKSVIYVMNLY